MSWWGFSDDSDNDDDAAADEILADYRRRSLERAFSLEVTSFVLQDPDVLSILMAVRCSELSARDGTVTNDGLREFYVAAAVCAAWRDAALHALGSREEQERLFPGCEAGTLPLRLVSTVGGVGHRIEFVRPSFVQALPDGAAFCADNHRVRELDVKGTCMVLRTLGHSGCDAQGLYHPMGLAVEGDVLYVADRSNHRVQKLRRNDGALLASTAGAGGLWGPYGLALLHTFLLVADANNSRLVALDARDLCWAAVVGCEGSGAGELDRPRGVAVAPMDGADDDSGAEPEGGEVFVADFGNNRVQVFRCMGCREDKTSPPQLVYTRSLAGHAREGLQRPYGVATGLGGLLFVSEWKAKRVQVLGRARGECLQLVWPPGCGHLAGLSAAGRRLLLFDAALQKLHVLETHAAHARLADGGGAEAAGDGGVRGDEDDAERMVREEAAAMAEAEVGAGPWAQAQQAQAEAEAAFDLLFEEEWLRHAGAQARGGTAVAAPAAPLVQAPRAQSTDALSIDRLQPRGIGHCAEAASGTYRYS